MGKDGPKYLKTSDVGLKNQNGISRKLERHCSSGPINLDIYRSILHGQNVSNYHPMFHFKWDF